jgi:hypothetical protein
MNDFFKIISDQDGLRQGDVLKRLDKSGAQLYGVILTADCDIAQNKSGGKITWLEIVSVRRYIEDYWSGEQLDRLSEKYGRVVRDSLNAKIRKINEKLAPLQQNSLAEWLKSSGADEVIRSVYGDEKSAEIDKVKRLLTGLSFSFGVDGFTPSFLQLTTAWNYFGIDVAKRREALANLFKSSGGFQDYFLLPELPNTLGYGYVVLLRSISTLSASDVFLNEVDARINDRPDAFFRLGRLHDGIRFAIAQKMAFLFSRIGMPSSYEDACEVSLSMVIDELLEVK